MNPHRRIAIAFTALIVPITLYNQPLYGNPLSPVVDPIEEIIEETVEEEVEALINEQVEEAIAQETEQAITETIEETVGDSVDQAIQEDVESQLSEQIEDTVTQSAEQSITELVEDTISDSVNDDITNSASESVKGLITQTTAESAGKVITDTLTQSLEKITSETTAQSNLLATLPASLPVKNDSGDTVFYDVAVENGWRAVRGEWLITVDADELQTLEAMDVDILERVNLPQLNMVLLRFRVVQALDSYPALQQQLPKAMHERLERNHIYNYRPQSKADKTTHERSRKAAISNAPIKVGILDTAINTEHSAFSNARITQHNFLDAGLKSPTAHGTAVAGVLVGNTDGVQATLPNASVAAATVIFERENGSQGSTMLSLLKALEWLTAQDVSVINMSIAGPPNHLFEQAINVLSKKNIAIVAAVGNDGPAAPALFPAAYENVIGVTAVDSANRIYRWANRGDHVDFTARGVGIIAVNDGGGTTIETGTSMASPIVASYVASIQAKELDSSHQQILERLSKISIDLGEPGKDSIFGFGLLE